MQNKVFHMTQKPGFNQMVSWQQAADMKPNKGKWTSHMSPLHNHIEQGPKLPKSFSGAPWCPNNDINHYYLLYCTYNLLCLLMLFLFFTVLFAGVMM